MSSRSMGEIRPSRLEYTDTHANRLRRHRHSNGTEDEREREKDQGYSYVDRKEGSRR